MNLSNISTKKLVEELSFREGVEIKTAEPHEETDISISGPAVVVVVTD